LEMKKVLMTGELQMADLLVEQMAVALAAL
jgi:hypothetical protein